VTGCVHQPLAESTGGLLFSVQVFFSFNVKRKGMRNWHWSLPKYYIHVCSPAEDGVWDFRSQNVLWHGNDICLIYSFTQLVLSFLCVYCWDFGLVCLFMENS